MDSSKLAEKGRREGLCFTDRETSSILGGVEVRVDSDEVRCLLCPSSDMARLKKFGAEMFRVPDKRRGLSHRSGGVSRILSSSSF